MTFILVSFIHTRSLLLPWIFGESTVSFADSIVLILDRYHRRVSLHPHRRRARTRKLIESTKWELESHQSKTRRERHSTLEITAIKSTRKESKTGLRDVQAEEMENRESQQKRIVNSTQRLGEEKLLPPPEIQCRIHYSPMKTARMPRHDTAHVGGAAPQIWVKWCLLMHLALHLALPRHPAWLQIPNIFFETK